MDVHKKDDLHRTVLHHAALHDNIEAVNRTITICGKQELESKDIDGRTPIQLAHQHGAYAVVNYLRSTYSLSLDAADMGNNTVSRRRSISKTHPVRPQTDWTVLSNKMYILLVVVAIPISLMLYFLSSTLAYSGIGPLTSPLSTSFNI